MSLSPARCQYFPVCNACQLWDAEYSDQQDLKLKQLRKLLDDQKISFDGSIEFISSGEYGLRSRVDFTFKFNNETGSFDFGFYDKEKQLVSVKKCLQMSSELQRIYNEFISVVPKVKDDFVKKGSVRLRSGLGGLKGCWLDLANVDIKHLLDDGVYLKELLKLGFKIEMGQKGKTLTELGGALKLSEPQPQPWFKTYTADGKEIPLNCLISDFTQPSWISAKELTFVVLTWISKANAHLVTEFGPGIGQFTLPLLASGISVTALEVNEAACENLRLNAAESAGSSLKIIHDDFQRRSFTEHAGCILVNPARSGLKDFTDSILKSKAQFLVYVSCFPESMCEDLGKLQKEFKVREIKIVDQFPQTNHFESCVFLERIK